MQRQHATASPPRPRDEPAGPQPPARRACAAAQPRAAHAGTHGTAGHRLCTADRAYGRHAQRHDLCPRHAQAAPLPAAMRQRVPRAGVDRDLPCQPTLHPGPGAWPKHGGVPGAPGI